MGIGGLQGDQNSYGIAPISIGGRYVAFQSDAGNWFAGDYFDDTDVFVRDRQVRTTKWVTPGNEGNCDDDYCRSSTVSMSADGRYIAFSSEADTIIAGDTNYTDDVFVFDQLSVITRRVSVGSGGQQLGRCRFVLSDCGSTFPSISADGRVVAFVSGTESLSTLPLTGGSAVYVHERADVGAPAYSRSPTSLSFGSQPLSRETAAKIVTLNNTGSVTLTIVSVALAGSNPDQFAQTSNCSALVLPGGTCTISVTFKPTSTGAKSATLMVTAGGGAGTKSVTLSGTGVM